MKLEPKEEMAFEASTEEEEYHVHYGDNKSARGKSRSNYRSRYNVRGKSRCQYNGEGNDNKQDDDLLKLNRVKADGTPSTCIVCESVLG